MFMGLGMMIYCDRNQVSVSKMTVIPYIAGCIFYIVLLALASSPVFPAYMNALWYRVSNYESILNTTLISTSQLMGYLNQTNDSIQRANDRNVSARVIGLVWILIHLTWIRRYWFKYIELVIALAWTSYVFSKPCVVTAYGDPSSNEYVDALFFSGTCSDDIQIIFGPEIAQSLSLVDNLTQIDLYAVTNMTVLTRCDSVHAAFTQDFTSVCESSTPTYATFLVILFAPLIVAFGALFQARPR